MRVSVFRLDHPFGGVRKYGLGVCIEGGSTGSTYGEPGRNMYAHVTLWLGRGWRFMATWKGKDRP